MLKMQDNNLYTLTKELFSEFKKTCNARNSESLKLASNTEKVIFVSENKKS